MTLKETRHCDVYGTTKRVRMYAVKVVEQAIVGGDSKQVREVFAACPDLSDRAAGRLIGFIKRGIAPPSKAATEAKQEPEVVASAVS